MAEVKAKYKSTEDELYAIANLAFDNLDADLAAFAAKKAKYTSGFVTALRGLRDTAMTLPDEESRSAAHETLQNQLPALLIPVKDNFNDLKGYIRDGWPGEDPVPRYEDAGLLKYNKIGANNWEEVVGLNQSMISFMNTNVAPLTSPGGMPGPFTTKVTTDRDNFNNVYNPFLSSKETSTARAAKVTANNNLYDAMMDMMKDGVEMVFRTDAAGKKRYTFSVLKDLVSPPGSASLKVTVKQEGSNAPLPNIPVTIQAEGGILISGKTDSSGVDAFPSIDPARYTVKIITTAGTLTFSKEVNTGVDARLEVIVPAV